MWAQECVHRCRHVHVSLGIMTVALLLWIPPSWGGEAGHCATLTVVNQCEGLRWGLQAMPDPQ